MGTELPQAGLQRPPFAALDHFVQARRSIDQPLNVIAKTRTQWALNLDDTLQIRSRN
jgi:hypothetical protein